MLSNKNKKEDDIERTVIYIPKVVPSVLPRYDSEEEDQNKRSKNKKEEDIERTVIYIPKVVPSVLPRYDSEEEDQNKKKPRK